MSATELKNWVWGKIKKSPVSVSAIIIAIGSVVIDFRSESRVEYRSLAQEYREETVRLRQIERQCLELEIMLTRELDQVRAKMILLESASQDLPFPHWLKSNGTKTNPGIMMAVNQAYENAYLIPIGKTASDYIGKTDAQFWGKELGVNYWNNDLKVINSGIPIDVCEIDPIITGDSIRVVKYPRKLGSRVIGIGGIVIPNQY